HDAIPGDAHGRAEIDGDAGEDRRAAVAAAAEAAGAVDALVVEDIEIAVLALRRACETNEQHVGHDRGIEHAAQIQAIALADRHRDGAALALRLARDEPHGAA